jgi:hypothetical protein
MPPPSLSPGVPTSAAPREVNAGAPAGPSVAGPAAVPWTSVVDRALPDAVDPTLRSPGMSDLEALSPTEAVIGLDPMQLGVLPTRGGGLKIEASAIVNLASGCIVATRPERRLAPVTDVQYLESPAFGRDHGQALADLARFELRRYARALVRLRSDGVHAISADHQKIAVTGSGKLFFSADGGKTFQVDANLTDVAYVYFGGEDKVLYVELFRAPLKASLFAPVQRLGTAVVDVQNGKTSVLGIVDTSGFTPLHAMSKNGEPLYAHERKRCVHSMSRTTLKMEELTCLDGPPLPSDMSFLPSVSPSGAFAVAIDGPRGTGRLFALEPGAKPKTMPSTYIVQAAQSDLQNFNFGPDDSGRFGWDSHMALRVLTPQGIFQHPWPEPSSAHTPIGFDLEGYLLWFNQPELVRPHQPMTPMPPTKGNLGDSLCKLVSRTDPTKGKQILPPL